MQSRTIFRRWPAFLLLAVLFGSAACGGTSNGSTGGPAPAPAPAGSSASHKPYAGQVLRVGMWGGDNSKEVAKIVGQPFTALTGAKVEYVAGNPSDNIAKVRAAQGGPAPMDIVNFSDNDVTQWSGSKLFAKLDYSKLPNAKDLPSYVKMPQFAAFGGLRFGLVYNSRKFKQLGLPAPKSVQDLFNPKLAGHVALPTSAVNWAPMVTMVMAAANGGGMTDLAPAYPAIKRLKVYYYYQASADLANKFSTGDVWAALWQDSYTFRLQAKGLPLEFVNLGYQSRTGWPTFDWYGIPAGSKNKALAEIYLNLALNPKIQAQYSKWGFFTPTNTKTFALIAGDKALASRLPTAKDMQNMVLPDWKQFYAHYGTWLKAYNAATSAR